MFHGQSYIFFPTPVSCGAHYSPSCEECPKGNGKYYCNGDCWWNYTSEECVRKPDGLVSCGGHFSPSCAECTQGHGRGYCNGDCIWNYMGEECILKSDESSPPQFTLYGTITEDEVTYLHELLSIVVQKFNEHNITYWLDGGTLLGATRNHPPGIIRNDDDIDLGVKDSDYERMHDILSKDKRLSWFRGDWGAWKYGLKSCCQAFC